MKRKKITLPKANALTPEENVRNEFIAHFISDWADATVEVLSGQLEEGRRLATEWLKVAHLERRERELGWDFEYSDELEAATALAREYNAATGDDRRPPHDPEQLPQAVRDAILENTGSDTLQFFFDGPEAMQQAWLMIPLEKREVWSRRIAELQRGIAIYEPAAVKWLLVQPWAEKAEKSGTTLLEWWTRCTDMKELMEKDPIAAIRAICAAMGMPIAYVANEIANRAKANGAAH